MCLDGLGGLSIALGIFYSSLGMHEGCDVVHKDKILGEEGLSKHFLDGCHHVYLDMGTNTGVQIRKLYQPHLFPNASVLPIFDKFFGPIGKRLAFL